MIKLGCGYVSRYNYGSNFELVREGGVCGGGKSEPNSQKRTMRDDG